MQFPVPQFTDVEDKIIASLTIKQFGILFGAGVVIFLGYSASKSVLVIIFLFMLFGVPALAVAFGKVNGRPLYSNFPLLIKYFTRPRFFVFKKEAKLQEVHSIKNVKPELSAEPLLSAEERKKKLLELQLGLDKNAAEKANILKVR